MADRERLFWGRIVENLWAPDRFLLRIESGISDGVPDSYYTITQVSGWMELKCPIEPARETTALFSGNHQLSMAQRNWLLAHRQAGGVGFVAIETERHVMLIGSRHVDSVNTSTIEQLRALADFRAVRPLKARDWVQFMWTLTERVKINKDLLP